MYSFAPAEVVTYLEEYDIETMDQDGWWSLASAMYSRYGALPTGVSAGATSTDTVASSTSTASAGTAPATSTLSSTSKTQSVTKSSAGTTSNHVVVFTPPGPTVWTTSYTTLTTRPLPKTILPKTITTFLTLDPTSTTVEQTETATETYNILASAQAGCNRW
jgi:hypothetical protein